MAKTADPYRFLSGITKRVVKNWIAKEVPRPIPWTPLTKPLADCTVALISSGGIALKTDRPFDQEGERQNPWWGDPSFRVLPRETVTEEVKLYHLHVNPGPVEQDLNCLLPLQRLQELEDLGEIGRSAPSHYSFMGYILDPQVLLEQSTPAMVHCMEQEEVDVAVLVPA